MKRQSSAAAPVSKGRGPKPTTPQLASGKRRCCTYVGVQLAAAGIWYKQACVARVCPRHGGEKPEGTGWSQVTHTAAEQVTRGLRARSQKGRTPDVVQVKVCLVCVYNSRAVVPAVSHSVAIPVRVARIPNAIKLTRATKATTKLRGGRCSHKGQSAAHEAVAPFPRNPFAPPNHPSTTQRTSKSSWAGLATFGQESQRSAPRWGNRGATLSAWS